MAKVLFIQDLAYEYFGTMHISSYLKQLGHDCQVLIEPLESDLIASALKHKPDIVAFSCLTPTVPWALTVAAKLKRATPSTPVIFGGSHVTLNPDDVIAHAVVDYVCVGEGEQPLAELCARLDKGDPGIDIQNLYAKCDGQIIKNPCRPLIQDLDALPFADRDLYGRYRFFSLRTVKTIMIGRGCPFQCNYCHNHAKMKLYKGLGKYVRTRSPEHVLREIDMMRGKDKMDCLHFIDDAFGSDKKWLRLFLPELGKRKLHFIGALRANCLDDELCELMKHNGLDYLSFAVETGDERYRSQFLKKTITDNQLYRAARMLRLHKIPFLTMNMVGLPDETLEQSLLTLELNMKLRPVYACCYIYQPYPNTELYQYVLDHGLLKADADAEMGFLSYDASILNQQDISAQKNIQRLFAATVMAPRLYPLTKLLVKLRPNPLFDGIFYLLYAYYLKRYFRLTYRLILYNIVFWIRFNLLQRAHE